MEDSHPSDHLLTESTIGFPDPTEPKIGDLIVVGVDGSKPADEALLWYKEHLHREGSRLLLVLALEWPALPTRDGWDLQIEKCRKRKEELVEKYDKLLKEWKIPGIFLSDFGKAGEIVVKAAKEREASFVVVGSRGLGAVKRAILGSVSDYVLHHSGIPVAVVTKSP